MTILNSEITEGREYSDTRTFSSFLGMMILMLMFWPLAHLWITRNYGSDPWEFFGAAMYCTTNSSTLEILTVTNSGLKLVPMSSIDSLELKNAIIKYGKNRNHLGLLAGPPPTSICDMVINSDSNLTDALIRTRSFRLNPRTCFIEADTKCVYHYRKIGQKVVLFDQDIQANLIN